MHPIWLPPLSKSSERNETEKKQYCARPQLMVITLGITRRHKHRLLRSAATLQFHVLTFMLLYLSFGKRAKNFAMWISVLYTRAHADCFLCCCCRCCCCLVSTLERPDRWKWECIAHRNHENQCITAYMHFAFGNRRSSWNICFFSRRLTEKVFPFFFFFFFLRCIQFGRFTCFPETHENVCAFEIPPTF